MSTRGSYCSFAGVLDRLVAHRNTVLTTRSIPRPSNNLCMGKFYDDAHIPAKHKVIDRYLHQTPTLSTQSTRCGNHHARFYAQIRDGMRAELRAPLNLETETHPRSSAQTFMTAENWFTQLPASSRSASRTDARHSICMSSLWCICSSFIPCDVSRMFCLGPQDVLCQDSKEEERWVFPCQGSQSVKNSRKAAIL